MGQRIPSSYTTPGPKTSLAAAPNLSSMQPKKQSSGGTSANSYFSYFSQRVSEQTNDTWVKQYLPLLKEIDDGYVRLPGSGKLRTQMNHDIKHLSIPLTMRGQAWPLLVGNRTRVTA